MYYILFIFQKLWQQFIPNPLLSIEGKYVLLKVAKTMRAGFLSSVSPRIQTGNTVTCIG